MNLSGRLSQAIVAHMAKQSGRRSLLVPLLNCLNDLLGQMRVLAAQRGAEKAVGRL